MVRKIEDHVKDCLDHAAKAGSSANETADPARKAEFLCLEISWIRLARSYEFAESLKSFLLKSGSVNAAVWGNLILKAYNSFTLKDPPVDQRTASLVRHGRYEVRFMELSRSPQEGTEHLWLELFDHDQQRAIDSYGGRTLVDITAAVESMCSKAKYLNDKHVVSRNEDPPKKG